MQTNEVHNGEWKFKIDGYHVTVHEDFDGFYAFVDESEKFGPKKTIDDAIEELFYEEISFWEK